MRKMTDNAKEIAAEIRQSLDVMDGNKSRSGDIEFTDRVYACTYKLAKVLDMESRTVEKLLTGLKRIQVGKRSMRYRISDVACRLDELNVQGRARDTA